MSVQQHNGLEFTAEKLSSQRAVKLARHPNLVMIQNTPKGRGIFASSPIPARTTVEVSPVLIMSPEENTKHISNTHLWFYTYNWPLENGRVQTQALPLGLGSLFNHASTHSRRHNTGFTRNVADHTISYITLRDVEAGEELCICYGEDARLGFVDSDSSAEDDEPINRFVRDTQPSDPNPETGMSSIDVSIFSAGDKT